MELGLAVFILTLLFVSTITQSIRFDIESGHIKCLTEDIKINSMTVGQYSVVNPNEGYPLPDHHKITVRMFSAKGNSLHKGDNVESGQFAFEVVEDGDHMVCFSAIDHQPVVNISVDFNWRSGIAAKDWSTVAKKGNGIKVEENGGYCYFNPCGNVFTSPKGAGDAKAKQENKLRNGLVDFGFTVSLLVCGRLAIMAFEVVF